MDILTFLEINKNLIYIFFSFVIIFSSIFPLNLFLYSEAFVLLWGILAWLEIIDFSIIFFVFIISWFIWDSISFLIWSKYWDKSFKHTFSHKIFKKYLKTGKYDKISESFKSNPFFSIFTWKFWFFSHYVIPYISWIQRIPYIDFIRYSSIWILLPVWFFSFIWLIIWKNFISSFIFIKNYIFLIIFGFFILFFLYLYFKRYLLKSLKKYEQNFNHKRINLFKLFFKHLSLVFISILIFYSITLYLIFFKFWNYNHITNYNFDFKLNNIEEITKYTNLNTYYDKNKWEIIQPINVIIITNSNISNILDTLWRIENKTFIWNNIKIREFYNLFKSKELPISILNLDWKAQNNAFQMKSTSNFKRNHLRIWNFWKLQDNNVYLISISKDTKMDLELYNKFLTPIHGISINVDTQRDLFLNQIKKFFPKTIYKKTKLNKIDTKLYKYNYITDWYLYIIQI